MRKTLTALALGVTMTMPPMLVPDAEADHPQWVFGGSFRIGDALFNIGYFPAAHPVYYYRTRSPLRYRDHVCHDRCYHRGGYAYHHASCPLVQRHFRHHRFEPRTVFVRYAPRHHDRHFDCGGYYDRYYGGYAGGTYDRGRHDRRHYDRDRGRHDRRHYDRDRDRGRHDRRHWDRRDDRGRWDRDDDRGRHRRHDRGRDRGHHRDRRWHDD
jgi:hypothetical protein